MDGPRLAAAQRPLDLRRERCPAKRALREAIRRYYDALVSGDGKAAATDSTEGGQRQLVRAVTYSPVIER